MEWLRGWRALREDPDSTRKILTGALIFFSAMIVPVIGQVALLGWMALTVRRAVATDARMHPSFRTTTGLPMGSMAGDYVIPRLDLDFDYLGKLLNSGFKPLMVQFLWSLPMIAIVFGSMCCGWSTLAIGGSVLGAAARHGGSPEAGLGMGVVGIVAMIGFGILFPILVVAMSAPMQVAQMRVMVTDDSNAGMAFKEVLKDTKLLLPDLIKSYFVMGAIGFGCALIGMALCGVGMYVMVPIIWLLSAFHKAELYRVYLEKGGTPLTLGKLDVA